MTGLVDCNNFFVSCERIFAPWLEGRPVAVLSNCDGVVVARSQELKALKIPMGEPYFKLKPLAPHLGIIFRSSNYELYGDISRRVMSLLREETPCLEQYSIDEAFLKISLASQKDYFEFAARLRKKILTWIGMPVSVGFAPSRTLAKIANHRGKSDGTGICVWPENHSEWPSILKGIPIEEIWGVGRATAEKMRKIGVRTALELASMDYRECAREYGICLGRTVAELQGHEAIAWDGFGDASDSLTRSRVFGQPVTSLKDLREALASYAEIAAMRMREMNRKAEGCTVFAVTYPEYAPIPLEGMVLARSTMFPVPTWNNGEINRKILPLISQMYLPGRRYKKCGISFWGLADLEHQPLDMFEEPPKPGISEKALAAMDKLNKHFGRGTLKTLATGLDDSAWRMRRDLLTPRYTTSWHDLPLAW